MKRITIASLALLLTLLACARASGPLALNSEQSAAPDYRSFDRRFSEDVEPVLQTYCYTCHSGQQPAAGMDLTTFGNTTEIVEGFGLWEHVHDRLDAGEMPPRQAPQPTAEERAKVIAYITELRDYEARRNAGDPGVVLAHRLSNAEYNYTIHDLTGFDLQPTQQFPVDPANEAGFDNTGVTLSLSPALLTRYLDAARKVSEHIVFEPRGLSFAPHVVSSDTDRDRYVVNRIMAFYKRQPMDLASYFFALWRYENRAALGRADATLEEIAAEERVSPGYLATVLDLLNDREAVFGPLADLQQRWDALPAAAGRSGEVATVRSATEEMRDFVVEARQKLAWKFEIPDARPVHQASQTLVMHVNRQGAAHRRKLNPNVLIPADQVPADFDPNAIVLDAPEADADADPDDDDVAEAPIDPALIIPSDEPARSEAIASLEKFSDVFPDAFLVSERTSNWLASKQTGRLLSAGYHGSMGYFRDDRPLYELILNDAERRELDQLWQELEFISNAPTRQLSGFVWFERTDSRFMLSDEFSHIRAEDQDLVKEERFAELKRLYLAKVVDNDLDEEIQDAIELFFDELGGAIRRVERTWQEAEPYHLEAAVEFAERAYRRPLLDSEREGLLSFYRELRSETDLSHQEAIRDVVASVLVSPDFSYRVDLAKEDGKTRIGSFTVAPLTDYALANRLSYFLWSSMPDDELLAHAAAGDLHEPEILRAQVRRMLLDDRVSRLATEFGTNWLGVRRFEEFNSVGRDRFPMFTDELRQAFFEEPIRFFTDLIREDRPVLDILFGDYTYVNPTLAAHYGMPVSDAESDEWVRVDNAGQYGRGGLLPMGVFLTNYSTGLRTSPVKRGHWVASKVLGQHIPAPPPDVPQLPADEADLGELTLRETLAQHRDNPACASCHATFDHFGLVLEGFGPVGERRERDLGNRPVETAAEFPNGREGTGLEGLQSYLRTERQNDFVDNFSRRLLTYGLGRALLLSDNLLVADMQEALEANEYRFSSLVETIVTSPQFLNKRMPDDTGGAMNTLVAGK